MSKLLDLVNDRYALNEFVTSLNAQERDTFRRNLELASRNLTLAEVAPINDAMIKSARWQACRAFLKAMYMEPESLAIPISDQLRPIPLKDLDPDQYLIYQRKKAAAAHKAVLHRQQNSQDQGSQA